MSKYTEAVESSIPEGFPYLVCGWPHDEYVRRHTPESEDESLGFTWSCCELCGAMPGERYAVTALPPNPAENRDYVSFEVCGDCLNYVANGEEPDHD